MTEKDRKWNMLSDAAKNIIEWVEIPVQGVINPVVVV